MASFQRAIDDGANALETDVHRTADGEIVVAHDPDVQGALIRSLTYAELLQRDLGRGERLPRLVDVLERFRDVPINVDLKQRGIAPQVVKLLIEKHEAERVLLTSFHMQELVEVRALKYPGPTGLAKDEVVRLQMVPLAVLNLWRLRGVRAQVPPQTGRWRFDTQQFVDKAHLAGIAVDYWTVNDVEQARQLLAIGADGLMSDNPGLLAPEFAKLR